MIFQHTIDQVLSGKKHQTRRVWKPGYEWDINGLKNGNRIQYAVGQPLAVQPGRGKKGVARIEVRYMREEDVRNISPDDLRAEGFDSYEEFIRVWQSMHGDNYHALVIGFELLEVT